MSTFDPSSRTRSARSRRARSIRGAPRFEASVATLLAARERARSCAVRSQTGDEEVARAGTVTCAPRVCAATAARGMRLAAWADAAPGGIQLERAALAIWRLPEPAT